MRKGQFTIMVVFGILAVVVVGFVLYINSQVTEGMSDEEAEGMATEFISADRVRNYVQSCLQAVAEEAMLLSAFQGGALYESQNGSVEKGEIDTDYVEYERNGRTYEVQYGIKDATESYCPAINGTPGPQPHALNIQEFLSLTTQVPDIASLPATANLPYDMLNFESVPVTRIDPLSDDFLNNQAYFTSVCGYYPESGFYGYRNARKLCLIEGPNWGGDPDNPTVFNTCEGRYAYPSERPLQYQLANYTKRKLAECADFTELERTEGVEIEALQKPSIEWVFGKQDVHINATYPIRVSKSGRPPQTLNIDFNTVINARYKELYEYYNDLLKREISNASFEMEGFEDSPFWRAGFETIVEKDCCGEDDMLLIKDTNSILSGTTLTIQSAIKDRAPVLEKIPEQEWTIEEAFYQDDFTLPVAGYDPDGDAITLEYMSLFGTGWPNPCVSAGSEGDRNMLVTATAAGKTDYQIVDITIEVNSGDNDQDGCQ